MAIDVSSVSKKLNKLDYVLSIGTLAFGLYFDNNYAIVGGVVGLFIAFVNPSKQVQSYISRKFIAKKKASASQLDALEARESFYSERLSEVNEAESVSIVQAPAIATFQSKVAPPSAVYLKVSSFNKYSEDSLKLAKSPTGKFA